MKRRMTRCALGISVLILAGAAARAQDVPGIEICTVDKTMERRTSCLQSNVDYLVKTINRLRSEQEQKLAAANTRIETLNNAVIALQKNIAELQSAGKEAPVQTQPPALKTTPEVKGTPEVKTAPSSAK